MKEFIIIGNTNCVLYNDIFPFIKERKMVMGHTHIHNCGESHFTFTDSEGNERVIDNARWFTSLQVISPKKLNLTKTYTGGMGYQTYDNYPAINADRVADIPIDYYGAIGTSIYFLNYDIEGWEIVDKLTNPVIDGKPIYKRIIVKRK